MQIVSVLVLLAPFYKVGNVRIDLMSVIFGSHATQNVIRNASFLIYVVILPVISVVVNLWLTKTNISNFFTYFVSFVNTASVLLFSSIVTIFNSDNEVIMTSVVWLYAILNLFIMAMSMFSLVVTRDNFLFKLEYSEKIEYIKEQKQKAEKTTEEAPAENMYKCSKCGKMVKKGSLCTCIPKKSDLVKAPEPLDATNNTEKNEAFAPASFCLYCKKPLSVGEACTCQGEGFGITIKTEPNTNRKCMYCGQVLVGESSCVCEKIMKNSAPATEDKEPKKYFESQIEKGNSFVADELAELEKMINSKFDIVKESIESAGGKANDETSDSVSE